MVQFNLFTLQLSGISIIRVPVFTVVKNLKPELIQNSLENTINIPLTRSLLGNGHSTGSGIIWTLSGLALASCGGGGGGGGVSVSGSDRPATPTPEPPPQPPTNIPTTIRTTEAAEEPYAFKSTDISVENNHITIRGIPTAEHGTLEYNRVRVSIGQQIPIANIESLVFRYEQAASDYTAVVQYSSGNAAEVKTIRIVVSATDDHATELEIVSVRNSISENASTSETGLLIGNINITDDGGSPGSLILEGDDKVYFEFDNLRDPTQLRLKRNLSFDHETDPVLTVQVQIQGSNPLVSSTPITVTVTDVNEQPLFAGALPTGYRIRDDIDAQQNGLVIPLGQVTATDPEGTTITYSVSSVVARDKSGNPVTTTTNLAQDFRVDANGNISYVGMPIKEIFTTQISQLDLTVTATDTSGMPATAAPIIITITTIDSGDAVFAITSDGDRNAPRIGDKLTVNLDTTADNDGRDPDHSTVAETQYSYQWYHVGAGDNGTDEDISGATDDEYTIGDADMGKIIGVRVTYPEESFESDGITPTVTETVSDELTTPILIEIYETPPTYREIIDGYEGYQLNTNYKDHALFNKDGNGFLKWVATPDFEDPKDIGKDNRYEIELFRSDNGQTHRIKLNIVVKDIGMKIPPIGPRPLKDFYNAALLIAPRDIPDEDKPSGFTQTLLRVATWKMPKTGPLLITYSISEEERNELLNDYLLTQKKVDEFYSTLKATLHQFEEAANIKFIEIEQERQEKIQFGTNTGSGNDPNFLLGLVPHIRLEFNPTGTDGVIFSNSLLGTDGAVISLSQQDIKDRPEWIILHEFAHGLHLAHPFDEKPRGSTTPSGSDEYWPWNPSFEQDPRSVVTYSRTMKTLQPADIEALQFLYGAPGTNFEGVESVILHHLRFKLTYASTSGENTAIASVEETNNVLEITSLEDAILKYSDIKAALDTVSATFERATVDFFDPHRATIIFNVEDQANINFTYVIADSNDNNDVKLVQVGSHVALVTVENLDFENPADLDMMNTYDIVETITTSSANIPSPHRSVSRTYTLTVTDVTTDDPQGNQPSPTDPAIHPYMNEALQTDPEIDHIDYYEDTLNLDIV